MGEGEPDRVRDGRALSERPLLLKTLLLADAHLSGPGGPAAPLLEQIRSAVAGGDVERLVLVGDLFQAWVGLPRFETPEIASTVAALVELRRHGLAIDYVEGNRDFFLQGSVYARAFDRLATEGAFTAGGVRYLAVHGDGLDPRDRQYRFWRALSKSGFSRFCCRRIPAATARRFVARTEHKLSQTNFQHKVRIPEEVIRAYGERRLAEGHDVLLLGHYHEPRTWSVDGGQVRLLEAWFRTRRLESVG